jgi:hypothetical protein
MPPRRTINASGDLVQGTPTGEEINNNDNNNNRMSALSSLSLWDAFQSTVSSLSTTRSATTPSSSLDFFGFNLNGRQVAVTLAGAWILLGSQTSTFSLCCFAIHVVRVGTVSSTSYSFVTHSHSLSSMALCGTLLHSVMWLNSLFPFLLTLFQNSGDIAGSLGRVYHLDKSGFHGR